MTDREINLHPKNNPSVNLKPNIVHGNIPEKAVSFKQLDENIQNKIDSQSFQIAKNTADISSLREKIDDEASTREDEDSRVRDEMSEYADHIKSDLEEKISTNKTDIAKNTADIAKNTKNIEKNTNNVASILTLIDIDNAKINPTTLENSIDGSDDVIVDVSNDKLAIHLSDELQNTISTHTSTIATNTADIAKNTSAISSLETRTKNLEDSVNTGTFDPTSDNPAGQKSTMDAIIESDLNARFSRASSKDLSGAFGNLPSYYSGKFHLLRETAFPWGADFDFTLLFAYTKVKEIDYSPSLDRIFEKANSINMSQCFLSSTTNIISATYSLRNVKNMYGAFNMYNIKTIKLRDYPVSFDISVSTRFEESDLVEIINNLMDLTGKTSQTLTMGATNLAKLTDAEKAIATNKNWTLA